MHVERPLDMMEFVDLLIILTYTLLSRVDILLTGFIRCVNHNLYLDGLYEARRCRSVT